MIFHGHVLIHIVSNTFILSKCMHALNCLSASVWQHLIVNINPIVRFWCIEYITTIVSSVVFGVSGNLPATNQNSRNSMHRCISPNVLKRADHWPLTRYVKLRVAHAPGMPGTFSPAAEFKGNRELAIPAYITARVWRTCRDACRDCLLAEAGKTFPAHAHPQFDVFGKRPIVCHLFCPKPCQDRNTLKA